MSVPAFWGRYGVNWGMHGSIVVDGGGYSRIAYGNAAWGGGNWQHLGGGVSYGGFGGGVGGGSSEQGANHASGSRLGASRASGGHQGAVVVIRVPPTPRAVTAAEVITAAVVVIRVPPTPAAVTAAVIKAN